MFDLSNLTRFLNPNLGEILDLFSLAPQTLWYALAILSFLFAVNYLIRTALMTAGVWSVPVHMVVCTLTLLPAILMAAILVWAAYRHPERAWINLGLAALLYLPWGVGGAITRLVRRDTEGADIGWMTMGAYITFPVGVVAALIFR
ncbi:MAG: hypothetical protein AAB225_09800 [Acidobacteriota bacterium]